MAAKEIMQVSIYLIDQSLFKEETYDEIVELIMSRTKDDRYDEELDIAKFAGYSLRLYRARNENPPAWRSFLGPILRPDSFIRSYINVSHAFILFVGYKQRIFAICGGFASQEIDRFADQTFGIEILTRLFEKNSKVIKYIQNRGVTGAVIGQSRFYRGDQRLSDDTQFGIIYKEVKADLDKKILTTFFGFNELELKRNTSGCLAKTSFKISKTIDFPTFLKIVAKLDEIIDKKANFSINHVELISKKKKTNTATIAYLNEALILLLYNNYQAGILSDFDFCHKDFEKFLTASTFISPNSESPVEFDNPMSFDEILKSLNKAGRLLHDTELHFKYSLLENYLYSRDEAGETLTGGNLFEHLHGEITYNEQTYFLIDGDWYRIKPDFIEMLNLECKEMIAQCLDETLLTEPFSVHSLERDYNEDFIGSDKTYVFDTITPENIEFCDIMKFDDTFVHLIHVKKGFDNRIRDLASQVLMAARRISQDKTAGYVYVKQIEEAVKRGAKSKSPFMQKMATQVFNPRGLKTVFEKKLNKNICFCLAFADTAGAARSLKRNVELFKSNIAKYSILELRKEIRSMGFDFKIIQLNTK